MTVLSEVVGGVRTARREWGRLLAISGTMTIATVAFAVTLSDVIVQWQVWRGTSALRAEQATVFTPYYESEGISKLPQRLMQDLATNIESGRAYTSVVNNVQIDNPDFADGRDVVILSGSAATLAIPGVELCNPAPCAMVGRDVSNAPSEYELNGFTAPVLDVLPDAATYVDPKAYGIDLSKTVVIVIPPSLLDRLDQAETEEAVTRMTLLKPEPEVIESLAEQSRDNGIYLVAEDLADTQRGGFRDMRIRSALSCLALGALFVSVLIAFASASRAAFVAQRRAMLILRMYGARPRDLRIRVFAYLATVTLLVPVPLLFGLALIGPTYRAAALTCVALLVILTVALGIRGSQSLLRRHAVSG